MAKQQHDVSYSADDPECRTVVLDIGVGPAKRPPPPDEEATVVLDLTPAQVHDMLTDAKPGVKALKK
jgi:hypothetical protein